MRASHRAGFTIIELVFAAAILALLSLNLAMVLRTSSNAFETGVFKKVIDDQAELTMDRISLAVMASAEKDLYPVTVAPLNTPRLDYQTCLGFQDGQLVMGDIERIEYVPTNGLIVWSQNPSSPDARSVVWSSWVPNNLEGEMANGLDDNGNGLIDEQGLSFDSSGPKVRILLTLERKDSNNVTYRRTLASTVTCRN
jgi:prepilin-type N-terminal cleavage/methylation domain-containing protein